MESRPVLKNNTQPHYGDEKRGKTMELIDAQTCKCSGQILIFDSPLEDPVLRPVTVQVSKLDWKLFEAICRDREELIKEFRNAYGQAGLEDLRGILDRIDQYAFTIAAYRHCPELQKWASPSSLFAAADRLGEALNVDLPPLIANAEIKLAKEARRFSIVPLLLVVYTNPISCYVLDSINHEMLLTDNLLRMAKNAN